jgi:F-type H+-transporting ATPase subunit b
MLLQLIIIQIITFFAIVFVLKKLLYTESAKESVRLRELKAQTALKQKELQEKIDAADNAYKNKIDRAEEEARRMRSKLEQETEEMRKKILLKAKEDSEHIIKSAFNAKEKIREEIALEMHRKAPLLASQILKETLSADVRQILHGELVRDVINSIKKTKDTSLKTGVDSGEVASAHPLKKNEKAEIESLLSDRAGHGITLHEKEDPKLVAGLIIKVGTILIDGSLDNRLRQAQKDIEG